MRAGPVKQERYGRTPGRGVSQTIPDRETARRPRRPGDLRRHD
jgi:hypothetical protein